MEFRSSHSGCRQVEYWDSFYRSQNGRSAEWCCNWTDLQGYISMLVPKPTSAVQILISGCGNSELSVHMYDAGWQSITNVDFSTVVIAEMLRLHVRSRPHMRWLVMDMTHLQFADACFDVVVDKGSLDALMGEVLDISLEATSYLSEVKRVLRPGGKYACVTQAHVNVLGLLLQTFRQGWLLNVHKILLVSNNSNPQSQPYLFYAIKNSAEDLAPVKCFFGNSQNPCTESQMQLVLDAVKEENRLRSEGGLIDTADVFGQLHQGRRTPLTLGGLYPTVVLDAKPDAEPPAIRCGVFLVPKSRAHEWLFSSEEGQWQVIETAQAGRLILVTLDAQQTDMEYIKQVLSPSIKHLLPLDCRESDTIPYMTTNDALSERILLEEIESPVTGIIHVEEVVLLTEDSLSRRAEASKPKQYRRLVFRRNPNLIQSEASLIPVERNSKERARSKNVVDIARRPNGKKKKSRHKMRDLILSSYPGDEELRVDFSYLSSEYHAGMISGLCLNAHNLEQWISAKEPIRAMIVGLGAGLLPMFVHNHIPVNTIQVVELDGVVGDVAKRHFGFVETERMQLCIADGVEAVSAIARNTSISLRQDSTSGKNPLGDLPSTKSSHTSVGGEVTSKVLLAEVARPPLHAYEIYGHSGGSSNMQEKLHILIIDADSEDPSTGLSCPPGEFLEEPFLRSAKEALVEGGILAINVVSRASSPHITAVALLQKVFEEVYDLEIEEHVNRVLFALSQQSHKSGEGVIEKARVFERITRAFAPWKNGPSVKEYAKKIKRLK
ncbi:uncharacterized protein [Physcomitrium patens]|uniref:Methyltransferase type 11 domain-containing protein n=1 Tax=Physcomitrium patens TaxID=3218 RepID=A0A2K1J2J9_PHYPA|nr:methyltransferase-like protein 13 isoform X1 [Physcomitrium patens]PNR35746.1 hypothetical protein PHYPA_021596 [Physcomitrium patens]|eukprot:XP_024401124.1 methyltransferase-like protein 13 isoform X1 [Physcomitrella patens]